MIDKTAYHLIRSHDVDRGVGKGSYKYRPDNYNKLYWMILLIYIDRNCVPVWSTLAVYTYSKYHTPLLHTDGRTHPHTHVYTI